MFTLAATKRSLRNTLSDNNLVAFILGAERGRMPDWLDNRGVSAPLDGLIGACKPEQTR
ncbi:hypothetical protein [Maritalea porphyrae]|uniref:Uncharacterized protein n=1 Tax=Maritalea porphyrae TaxID=880732 RepID=A0ABQ5URB3_9HYPH|nr:hypothetical protein [Maritalea porphyrae]GLQ17808.1 hypothetical protein GCM10007879_20570 [Maritalea porphyrae]